MCLTGWASNIQVERTDRRVSRSSLASSKALFPKLSHFPLRQTLAFPDRDLNINLLISQTKSKSPSNQKNLSLSAVQENYTPMRMNAMAITKVRKYPLRGSLFFP